ncbi:MAG: phosphatidylserine decarboxylase [Planctomycetota bacterium]|jgi:phosphatidylserine decarboxylase|nr:phosphatidylserine decarboxylase [Planctomycetota bacterium]
MAVTPYGKREIALGSGVFVLLSLASILAWRHYESVWPLFPLGILVPLFFWLLWFFRDPDRTIPGELGLIVSPADGTVTHIDEVNEPEFIGGPTWRLSIFLSVLDVHLNRAPASGRVEFLKFRPGAFFDARREESLIKNQNQDMGLMTDEKGFPSRLLIRQSSGAIARNIVCPVSTGAKLARGERYGMIKFGSRTTLFVSRDAEVEWLVRRGDRVKAGETALARVLGGSEEGKS